MVIEPWAWHICVVPTRLFGVLGVVPWGVTTHRVVVVGHGEVVVVIVRVKIN